MKKFLLQLTLLFSFASINTAYAERVLMVVTSAGEDNPSNAFDYDELTMAYNVFANNGYEVVIASPRGGKPVAENSDPSRSYIVEFINNKQAVTSLNNTVKLKTIGTDEGVPADFDAIFVVGGSGASVDLPYHAKLRELLVEHYQNKKVIGGICHGPAVLAELTVNGEPLIKDKRVTAFTDREDELFAEAKVPSVQQALEKAGAHFVEAEPVYLNVVRDGRIVTGQNPFAAAKTAEEMVIAMGGTPKARKLNTIETTVLLMETAAGDVEKARAQLAQHPENHFPMLLAMLGYKRMEFAEDDSEARFGLSLMELSNPYVQHPVLAQAMAKGYLRFDEQERARKVLESALEQHPENNDIKEQLAALES